MDPGRAGGGGVTAVGAEVVYRELTALGKSADALAALGEAEKRTAELRTQNAGLQRQVVDEAQRKADALHAAALTVMADRAPMLRLVTTEALLAGS